MIKIKIKIGAILIAIVMCVLLFINNNPKIKCEVFLMSKGYKLLAESDEKYPVWLKNKYAKYISLKLNPENITPICNKNYFNELLALQPSDMQKYIDKTIDIYIFAVNNHPLQEKIDGGQKPNSVLIGVFMYKNKIIGGCSMPMFNGYMRAGEGIHSLEGNTIDEMSNNK